MAATLSDAAAEAFAHRLYEAERARSQTRALSIVHPDATLADAYRVQDAFVGLKIAVGARSRATRSA